MYYFDKYLELGYENREDYLNSLAMEYNLPYDIIYDLANSLGEQEDFDGLINELDDYTEREYFGITEDFDELIPIEDDEPIFD